MKLRNIALAVFTFISLSVFVEASNKVEYEGTLRNINRPHILYWFIDKPVLQNDRYLSELDSIATCSPFDLVFLTSRDGTDFYDYQKMRPIFERLVKKAHEKNIKIGLQLWSKIGNVPLEHCMCTLSEQEVTLDNSGCSSCELYPKNIRDGNGDVLKSELFKAWAFKKTGEGFYARKSLQDITGKLKVTSIGTEKLSVKIDGGKKLAGYTVYMLARHYYDRNEIYGGYESASFIQALREYSSIPFDATALDEYTQLRITPPGKPLQGKLLTERPYSDDMAKQFKLKFGTDLESTLLAMRFVPKGDVVLRMTSINHFMDFMREAPLRVEKDFYKESKHLYGNSIFSGVHNTHHNNLMVDELWVTGDNWWTIPREYGQTDEITLFPAQMGIAQCASQNMMYNMYYNKSLEQILNKATDDLAYGIRTHYHAYNDKHGWGVDLSSPEFMSRVKPIEKAATLLNMFNPALPKMDVLLIFGMEALQNWYPDVTARNRYQLNSKVDPEQFARELWDKGYCVTLVSSDVIAAGKLKVENDGRMNLNGHIYDKVAFLYPQYMKVSTLSFLEEYKKQNGRLLLFGNGEYDFDGHNIKSRLSQLGHSIKDMPEFIQALEQMKVKPNRLPGTASINEDGSYVETSYPSLCGNKDMSFKVSLGNHLFTGTCHGMIAIQTDGKSLLRKLAAVGLSELKQDGNDILKLVSPSDVYISYDKNDSQK